MRELGRIVRLNVDFVIAGDAAVAVDKLKRDAYIARGEFE